MSSAADEKNKIKVIFSNLIDQKEDDDEEDDEDEEAAKKEENGNREGRNGDATNTAREAVTCNPQSKDLFLERVKTFTTNNWAAKPIELSPLHCAQYGWSNTHLDHLECVTCRATLYAGIPDEWDASAYAEICNKLQSDLQIGHKQLCPWPKNPCPRSFLALPCYTADQWKKEVIAAFESLVLLKSNLPELCEDEVAAMKVLDNTCMEALLSTIFKYSGESDDEALQGKVGCILSITGWSANKPIVEDPSISCKVCGKEVGLWNYKSLASRGAHKRIKESFEGGGISQQSLAGMDNISSNVSVKSEKSEKSERSETSNHSGSMAHELSRLATSSDSLAHSDLLKPASSQESLVNLRVSDLSKQMMDDRDYRDNVCGDNSFKEPRIPVATPPELMKELLLSTAPGSNRTHSVYSDSIFSEVGSECFEKRLEDDTTDKELELDRAINDNPPANHPNHCQQQWMKELLFMTAESKDHPEITESVMSEIGSISFDRRVDNCSVMNSPRSTTPNHGGSLSEHGGHGTGSLTEFDDNEPVRTKRMRFQEPDITLFSVLGEHRPWCPWITPATPIECKVPIECKDPSAMEIQQQVLSPCKHSSRSGWRVVLGAVLPSLRINAGTVMSSPNCEAWKSVRSILHECISTSADYT